MPNKRHEITHIKMVEYKIPTKDDLKQIPKDEAVDAVVVNVEIKTWKEKLNQEQLSKFKTESHDDVIVFVKYDCEGIIREDSYNYAEKPPTNSFLGMYMVKYDAFPTVGHKVRVFFDKDSKSKITL